jgi:hypothetical protein
LIKLLNISLLITPSKFKYLKYMKTLHLRFLTRSITLQKLQILSITLNDCINFLQMDMFVLLLE